MLLACSDEKLIDNLFRPFTPRTPSIRKGNNRYFLNVSKKSGETAAPELKNSAIAEAEC